MEVRIGKWEKNGMQRIYFNANVLGSAKVYAYAGKDGIFNLGRKVEVAGLDKFIYDVENEGCKVIEALVGKPISFDTKFADIWAAVS